LAGAANRPEIADLFPSKPDRAFAAAFALLIQPIVAAPAPAVEAAPLDDAVLRQSTAPTTQQNLDKDQNALQSEQSDKPEESDARRDELSHIVRATETDLRATTPEPPLSLNVRPQINGLQDPATNFVFSANLSTTAGPVGP
jgi:uncharacterized protein involved in copper resistance